MGVTNSIYAIRNESGQIIGSCSRPSTTRADATSIDEGSAEWLAFLEEEKNVSKCTKLQMIDELGSRGLEDDLFLLIESDTNIKRRWDAASSLQIGHPLVTAMATALSYDAKELQELFNSAAAR